jgi:sugar transferase (PEP-CTERM/EpsH1 system associated)
MNTSTRRLRIVHVVYSFGIGGLENVIVQLINRLPADRFEHVLLSLTSISDFKSRIERPDVQFIELHKPPGHAIPMYPRVWRLLRQLRPDVVHTCNLAALELVPVAWLAGVPLRIHAEHGWDAHDPDGCNPRYQRLRRLYKPFVSHYVAVSRDLFDYLGRAIGVSPARRSLIPNGVDTQRFQPATETPPVVKGCPFDPSRHRIVGTVGRLQTVKNQPLLARAFVQLLRQNPALAESTRLVIVGEGPLRTEVEAILREAGLEALAWLPGARSDVADILRMLSVFVLPSQTEGTSCTLQEAMATGLAVVATSVGGNPALLDEASGVLVPPQDCDAMARALSELLSDDGRRRALSERARSRAVRLYGVDAVAQAYSALFTAARRSLV